MDRITLDSEHGRIQRVTSAREYLDARPQYLHLVNTLGFRQDANESALIARALDYVASRATEVMYAELKALRFFPIISEVPLGAKTFTFAVLDVTGQAERVTGRGNNLPRAGVKLDEVTAAIASYGAAYGWTTEELRAFDYANGNGRGPALALDTKRADVAMKMIARKLDSIVAFGDDDDARITGALNNSNVYVGTVGYNWLLVGTTYDQMLSDLLTLANYVVTNSKEVFKPDTILLPTAHLLAIQAKQNAQGTRSVLQAFNDAMEAAGRNVAVESWPLLATANAAGTGPRAMAYVRDPELIGSIVPAAFIAQPPQARDLEWVVPCEGVCGGAAVRVPVSCVYYELTPAS